jgi:predicted RNase H-like HicB family nuclease
MQKVLRNYRIIIKPDIYPDTNKPCYSAFVPTLGLADYGDSIEEAVKNTGNLIKFHLESLEAEGKEIPVDQPDKELVTELQV